MKTWPTAVAAGKWRWLGKQGIRQGSFDFDHLSNTVIFDAHGRSYFKRDFKRGDRFERVVDVPPIEPSAATR